MVMSKKWIRAYVLLNSHYGNTWWRREMHMLHAANSNCPELGRAPTARQVKSQMLYRSSPRHWIESHAWPTVIRLTYTPGPHGAVWNQKTNSDRIKCKSTCQIWKQNHFPCTGFQLLCTILALFWPAALSKNALRNRRQLQPFLKTLTLPYPKAPTEGLNRN